MDKITNPLSFEDVKRTIADGKPIAFSRYGDGQFQCMAGASADRNCDGHLYFVDMAEKLKLSLRFKQTHVTYALQPKAIRDMPDVVDFYAKGDGYANADIFHNANIEDDLWDWWSGGRFEFILVGPHWVCPNIVIPAKNCWLQYERMKAKCVDLISNGHNRFAFCSSMPTNILIWELSMMYDHLTMLDLGSALDPYYGVSSRKYHAQIIERERKK